jgi:hypothetical protein
LFIEIEFAGQISLLRFARRDFDHHAGRAPFFLEIVDAPCAIADASHDENIGYNEFARIARFVVEQKVTRHVHIRLSHEIIPQGFGNIYNQLDVKIGFTHWLAVRFGIIDRGRQFTINGIHKTPRLLTEISTGAMYGQCDESNRMI